MRKSILCGWVVLSLIAPAGLWARSVYDQSKGEDWYRSAEGRRQTDCILSWQSARGDWPKNMDTSAAMCDKSSDSIRGTFDNGGTRGEMRYLARAWRATGDQRSRQAFLRGLDHILDAQYPSGGWPQSFPASGYSRYVTFNDGTMVGLMEFVREVAQSADASLVDGKRRQACAEAFDKGVEFILNSQIIVQGRRTVWCAQHDPVDYRPRPARSYELESLSGSESVGILRLLMSIEEPTDAIARSIEAGVAWFEDSKITGHRLIKRDNDRLLVEDPQAPPLWARFYDIETQRPFFCGRDGVKKSSMAEIELERRMGYSWYSDSPAKLFPAYAEWRTKTPSGRISSRQ